MGKETISGRNGKIELLRFLAAIFIMNGHLSQIGFENDRPFLGGWFYVEFFFMLTGYFTMMHFEKKRVEAGIDVVTYTAEIYKVSAVYDRRHFADVSCQ